MNESEKNIETCLPESILAEVASVPQDPQFVSLVEESFDPLQQQAVQQAGSDAYNEVVASHQPYTFTSSVRQMKSNLILLLRRLWRFPFGAGTLRSLSDMWQHYITRLQGSETYGIPSRLDQLTDLPSAPLLVADRKISEPNAIDGISLVHLLCSSTASEITELVDDNEEWEYAHGTGGNDTTRSFPFNIFNNLKVLTLRCKGLLGYAAVNGSSTLEVLNIPYITELRRIPYQLSPILNLTALKTLYAPSVGICINESTDYECVRNCNNLQKIVLGKLTIFYDFIRSGEPNLVHFEIGEDTAISLNMSWWTATNALDPTGTELVEDPTAHPTWNNLQQFLQNFRSFIVLRLANRKSTTALTLTLSAAVYNAVTGANSGWASLHTLAELGITDNDLTDLETELGITSATIYATWLDTYTGANGIHWDINKAN